jgi:hypothetical protein
MCMLCDLSARNPEFAIRKFKLEAFLGAAASSSSQHAVTKPSLPAAEACFDAGAGRISQLLCIYNLLSIDLNGGRA